MILSYQTAASPLAAQLHSGPQRAQALSILPLLRGKRFSFHGICGVCQPENHRSGRRRLQRNRSGIGPNNEGPLNRPEYAPDTGTDARQISATRFETVPDRAAQREDRPLLLGRHAVVRQRAALPYGRGAPRHTPAGVAADSDEAEVPPDTWLRRRADSSQPRGTPSGRATGAGIDRIEQVSNQTHAAPAKRCARRIAALSPRSSARGVCG